MKKLTDEAKSLKKALEEIRDIILYHGRNNRLPIGASRQIDTIAQIALRPYLKENTG